MIDDLTTDQKQLRTAARNLVDAHDLRAWSGDADRAAHEEAVTQGWPDLVLPSEAGGLDVGATGLTILLEEAGAALLPSSMLGTLALLHAVHRSGDAAADVPVEALRSGSVRVATGLGSSDPVRLLGPADAQLVAIADTDELVLVDGTPQPLQTIDQTRSYSSLDAGTAAGRRVSCPGVGDLVRTAVAAELLGVARRALEMSVGYSQQRHQFGRPIATFQAVSHRLAEMYYRVESLRSAVTNAAWAADEAPELLPHAAAMAHRLATSRVPGVVADAFDVHGGIAFTWELPLHLLYRRAQALSSLTTAGGDRTDAIVAALEQQPEPHLAASGTRQEAR